MAGRDSGGGGRPALEDPLQFQRTNRGRERRAGERPSWLLQTESERPIGGPLRLSGLAFDFAERFCSVYLVFRRKWSVEFATENELVRAKNRRFNCEMA